MGNDDFRLATFAFFGDYYSLCAGFLTHDRRKFAQKQFPRRHCLSEPQGQQLRQSRLFLDAFRS